MNAVPELVLIAGAQPIGDQQIPSVTIQITPRLTLDGVPSSIHETQAQMIADALERSLPGGTWDHLVAELVRRHATILVVKR